jgi:hypothetical protein
MLSKVKIVVLSSLSPKLSDSALSVLEDDSPRKPKKSEAKKSVSSINLYRSTDNLICFMPEIEE